MDFPKAPPPGRRRNWRDRLLALAAPKPWKLGVLYAVVSLGPFLTDHVSEIFGQPPRDRWYSWLLNWTDPNWLYQQTLFSGQRGITPDFVAVVMIRSGVEPDSVIGLNVCRQRAFLARVIDRIADAHPAVIAIDKSYKCKVCGDDDAGTAELRRAISRVSNKVPVIVGLRDEDLDDIKQTDSSLADRLRAKGMDRGDQILIPALDLGGSSTEAIGYGLIRIDKDTRRVPLGWKTYESRSALDPSITNDPASQSGCLQIHPNHQMMDTLSVAAARAFNGRRFTTRLLNWQQQGVHPFFSFFRPDGLKQLTLLSPIKLLCGQSATLQTDWTHCQPSPGDAMMAGLRNKVVFLGEDTPTDRWTPIRDEVPGVVLQASYAESLIEKQYLRPVPGGIDVVVSFFWLVMVELIFRSYSNQPERALVLALISTAALMLLFYRFVIVEAGVYFNLWPPGVAVIIFRYLGAKVPEPKRSDE